MFWSDNIHQGKTVILKNLSYCIKTDHLLEMFLLYPCYSWPELHLCESPKFQAVWLLPPTRSSQDAEFQYFSSVFWETSGENILRQTDRQYMDGIIRQTDRTKC